MMNWTQWSLNTVLTYTIVITNFGPNDAYNVVITDTLPNGTSFEAAPVGCTAVVNQIVCTIGTIAVDKWLSLWLP
ncbi:MAG: hypothetical protein R2932_55430 [Caldilineaceae bacterium]